MKKPVIRALLVIKLSGLVVSALLWFVYGSSQVSRAAIISTPAPQPLMRITGQPDYLAINRTIDKLESTVPIDVIKAVAWTESRWRHFNSNGEVFYSVNRKKTRRGRRKKTHLSLDWGMMQINDKTFCLNKSEWQLDQIKNDPVHNLKAGIAVLEVKQDYVRRLKRKKNWPDIERRYRLKGQDNLAVVIKAYNGFQRSWRYSENVMYYVRTKPWEKAMLNQLREESGSFYLEQMVGYTTLEQTNCSYECFKERSGFSEQFLKDALEDAFVITVSDSLSSYFDQQTATDDSLLINSE